MIKGFRLGDNDAGGFLSLSRCFCCRSFLRAMSPLLNARNIFRTFFSFAFEVGPFYSGKCARRVKKYRGDLFVLSQFFDVQN